MAEKYYDKEINASTDWGGDKSTGGLPVTGKRVQEFIKKTLNSKAGVFFFDVATNLYLIFSDEASRDAYLADRDKKELLLGFFEAPKNYEAKINLLSDSYVATLFGTTGNSIRWDFNVTNKDGASTGEGVIATYSIQNGNTTNTITQKYRNGQTVDFNVDDYLKEGTNTIRITIISTDTMASTSIAVTYQVVNLSLSTDYNISKVYNPSDENATAEIEFTTSGSGTKIMEWYLDGQKLEFDKDTDEVLNTTITRTKYLSLNGVSEGVHTLQFRASVKVNGETFYSKTFYRELMVADESEEPLIAVSAELGVGELVTERLTLTPQQYTSYPLTFAVYDPSHSSYLTLTIAWRKGEKVVGSTNLNAKNDEVYIHDLNIADLLVDNIHMSVSTEDATCEKIIDARVNALSLNLYEITSNLQLALEASSKNNDQPNKNDWAFEDIHASFKGVKWNTASGWVDGALRLFQASMKLNIAPLSPDPSLRGKTIELEFATENVVDDDEILCDMRDDNGAGMLITASQISIISSAGRILSTRFKNGDFIRVSIVINKPDGVTDKRLALIYINGIVSGAIPYEVGENFMSAKKMVLVSKNAALLVRSIRIYDTALTADNILNNFILYRPSSNEMFATYRRNDIYNDGTTEFNVDKMANTLPVMIITGDIPTLESATSKNTAIVVDVEYINMQDTSRSFTMKNAQMTPQGTSSMGYPKKNFRLYTQKRSDTILYDADGNVVEDRLYSFMEGAIPVKAWCFKADYAESSGTHNTGVARLWNSVMKNAQFGDKDSIVTPEGETIDLKTKYGEFPLQTMAQKAAKENNYPYDVRTAIDGFPILMFYRKKENDDLIFIGKYNFNNDKSTENVFGFKNIPGFDNSNMQCYEVLNNGNDLALFNSTANFDSLWSKAFESRYPDTKTPSLTALKRLCEWVVSCKNDQGKFDAEVESYFDLPKLAAYYVYLMRFGAVDQTVKNAMMTTEDGLHWFFINYDNDTVLGLRNDGPLVFSPFITRQTEDGGDYAYAGHESTLWNCFEASQLCMSMVSAVDASLYKAGLSVATVTDMFNNQQAGKWNERIFNQDAQYKYKGPYLENGVNNLFMLQGSRSSHRAWWLSRRFSYYDSMFVTGSYKSNSFEVKLKAAPKGLDFDIVCGYHGYYGYGVNDIPITYKIEKDRDESITFTTQAVLNVGDPIRIYMAPNIKSIDIHNFAPYLTQLTMNKVWSDDLGSQLKELVLGGDEINAELTDLSGLPSAKYLEKLNVRNFQKLLSLDLSEMRYLKELYAGGSGLNYVSIAEGAPITLLELPESVKSLSLKGCEIYSEGIKIEGNGRELENITLLSCPNLKTDSTFILDWYKNKTAPDNRCSLDIEVEWTDVTVDQLIALGALKTNGGSLRLRGKAVLTESLSQEAVETLSSIYGANVFKKTGEFHIDAPSALYIIGPSEVEAGTSAKYTIAAFGDVNNVNLTVSGNTPAGVAVDTVKRTITADRVFTNSELTLRVTARDGNGRSIMPIYKTVKIVALRDLTSATISGAKYVRNASEAYKLTLQNTNARYSVAWSISGAGVNNLELSRPTNSGCMLTRIVQPTLDTSVTLTATITSESGKAINAKYDMYAGGLIDMTGVSISGATSTRRAETYILDVTPGIDQIETVLTTEWSISGAAVSAGYVSLVPNSDKTLDFCSVTINSLPEATTSSYTLTAVVKSNAGKTLTATKYITILEAELEAPEENGNIQMLVKPKSSNNTVRLVISGSGYTVNWGDGISDSEQTHVYPDSSLYNIEIENCENVTLCSIPQIGDIYAYWSIGNSKVTGISFDGATTLKSFKKDIFKNDSARTSFRSCFKNCSKLTTIPAGLFDNCSKVTYFDYCFQGCTGLTSIPEGLFDACTAVTTFAYCFNNCKRLTTIPEGLFDACTAVTTFAYCFQSCTALSSIPAGLFSKNVKVTNFSYCFTGCSSLISIPDNMFDGCLAVTTFGNCFQNCTALTSIPAGLFSACTAASNFNNSFGNCVALASIPAGLFDNNKAVSSFTGCFMRCVSLISIPEGLFKGLTKASLFASCFQYCDSLTSIPKGLFDDCTSAFSFQRCFQRCPITAIPNGLFDNCTAASTFSYCFADCKSLLKVPTGLFNSCTDVLDFSYCFSGCTALTKATYQSAPKCTKWTNYANSTALTEVVITDTQAPNTYVTTAFSNAAKITFYVPDVDAYKDATNWTDLTIKAVSEYNGD